ncbi:hypothetical protein AX17_004694 [Amanita inopinata Kibby_2008]|nr:hypothetical protein AX17_004694 [Amanita inopinata Kibby_2008]
MALVAVNNIRQWQSSPSSRPQPTSSSSTPMPVPSIPAPTFFGPASSPAPRPTSTASTSLHLPAHNERELTREMLITVLDYLSTLLPSRFNNRLVRLVVHGGASMLLHPDLDKLASQTPPFLLSPPAPQPATLTAAFSPSNSFAPFQAQPPQPPQPTPTPIPDVKRTHTRDVDIIARSFAAEWHQLGIPDSLERLQECIAVTARQFGLGLDWMNADADIALPMAQDPETNTTYDPIHRAALQPNNVHLHTVYKSSNGLLQLISVTPFWAVALKLVRYTKWDPGDICLLLRNGTNLSGTQWTPDLVEDWLVNHCWPMGYASYDLERRAVMRTRIEHAVAMVNAYGDVPLAISGSNPRGDAYGDDEREAHNLDGSRYVYAAYGDDERHYRRVSMGAAMGHASDLHTGASTPLYQPGQPTAQSHSHLSAYTHSIALPSMDNWNSQQFTYQHPYAYPYPYPYPYPFPSPYQSQTYQHPSMVQAHQTTHATTTSVALDAPSSSTPSNLGRLSRSIADWITPKSNSNPQITVTPDAGRPLDDRTRGGRSRSPKDNYRLDQWDIDSTETAGTVSDSDGWQLVSQQDGDGRRAQTWPLFTAGNKGEDKRRRVADWLVSSTGRATNGIGGNSDSSEASSFDGDAQSSPFVPPLPVSSASRPMGQDTSREGPVIPLSSLLATVDVRRSAVHRATYGPYGRDGPFGYGASRGDGREDGSESGEDEEDESGESSGSDDENLEGRRRYGLYRLPTSAAGDMGGSRPSSRARLPLRPDAGVTSQGGWTDPRSVYEGEYRARENGVESGSGTRRDQVNVNVGELSELVGSRVHIQPEQLPSQSQPQPQPLPEYMPTAQSMARSWIRTYTPTTQALVQTQTQARTRQADLQEAEAEMFVPPVYASGYDVNDGGSREHGSGDGGREEGVPVPVPSLAPTHMHMPIYVHPMYMSMGGVPPPPQPPQQVQGTWEQTPATSSLSTWTTNGGL